jgi:hypothetical protein
MAPLTTTTHKPIRAGNGESGPAVINVRRPASVRTETPHFQPGPQADFPLLDDVPPPQTALRLPDLAAMVKRLPKRNRQLGAIAQWAGIAVGGLLALWLIFADGPPPVREINNAPAWSPPSAAKAKMAKPAWNVPGAEGKSPAPARQTSPADASSPSADGDPNSNAQQPNPNDPVPPDLPEWDDSAARAAPPADAAPAVRTAQRDGVSAPKPPGGAEPSEAPPLGITVPVPQ